MTFLWLCPSPRLPACPPARRRKRFLSYVFLSGSGALAFLFFSSALVLVLLLRCSIITAQHSIAHDIVNGAWVFFHQRTDGRTDGLAWMGMGGAGFLLGTDNGHGARRKTKKRRPQQEGVRFGSFLLSGRAFLFLGRSYTLLLPHTPLIGRRTLGSWIPVCGLIHPWLGRLVGQAGSAGDDDEDGGRFLSGSLGFSFGLRFLSYSLSLA